MIDSRFIRIAAASVLACIAAHTPAEAQTWPSRPMTMVVPFAAGGGPTSWDESWRRGCRKFSASR